LSNYFEKISTGEKFYYTSTEEVVNKIFTHFPGIDTDNFDEVIDDIIFPLESTLSVAKMLLALRSNLYSPTRLIRYTAKITENPSGKSYSISFRNPLLLDPSGKYGRKVNKGLGNDLAKANKVLEEVNELLSKPIYHSGDGWVEARKKFSDKAIEIFYSPINKMEFF
jgi:hypothetical protein